MDDLLPGTEINARGLRWEVVFTQPMGAQTMVRLRGLAGALTGREIDFLHPFEKLEIVRHDLEPEKAGALRAWLVYHQAFLLEQALGPDALLAAQPGRLEIQPYQLVPVLRALGMSRVRMMLADGVGLGKTVEAGLVLTELIARRLVHRVLIVSPAGPLLDQWKTEMRERFGLRFEVMDRARIEEIRRSTELGSNHFDHVSYALASIDFLKQDRVLDQLERAAFDVVVIDEAHHCSETGGFSDDREDSQRRKLSQVLARRSDGLLLLTATPHDGNDRSFASLCELLDPSLVDGRGVLRGERYRAHVVRRLSKHVKDPKTGKPLLPERVSRPCPVKADPQRHGRFIEFHRELLALIAPELRRAFRTKSYSDVLSYFALLKRSVSTVEACRSTLQVVRDRIQGILAGKTESQESRRQRLKTLKDLNRRLARFGTASAAEEEEKEELEAEDIAQRLAEQSQEESKLRSESRQIARTAGVVDALDRLVALAGEAVPQDVKLDRLVAEIAEIRRDEPGANVLVYTEYETSLRAAAERLRASGLGEVLTLSGEDDEARRLTVTSDFRSRDGIVLASTDTTAEGLNLQARCHHLIHLELPFNPNRLEQRNGRIDRFGQTKNPVVLYLCLQGTFEERILLRLIRKYERQRARLTFVPNTLGLATVSDAVNDKLLAGFLEEETTLFRREEPTLFDFSSAKEDDDGAEGPTRELLEEIDRTLKGYERATRIHGWLSETGLNAEERLLTDADRAREAAQRAGSVDLARFVLDALQLDGGEVAGRPSDPIFEAILPPVWCSGLEDVPGFDPDSRRIRLTTQLDLMKDSTDRPVGYLGRAHPLVRRALDRVRHKSLGADAQEGYDVRVSAVAAHVTEPALIFTFLGRVSSAAGREFERVLAVEIERGGKPRFIDTPSEWLPRADPAKAIRTADLWKNLFAGWGQAAGSAARDSALTGFRPLATSFVKEWKETIGRERAQNHEWLRGRSSEITEAAGEPQAQPQPELFDRTPATVTPPAPTWRTLADPAERLQAFAADPAGRPAARAEAEGVLRIYRQRMAALDARLALREPEIVPLGLLMLVPERR